VSAAGRPPGTREPTVALMGIGEFARLSRVSPKALRRYDELGLLRPSRVDAASGYRWYSGGQLDQARLVAALRQIGVPLAIAGRLGAKFAEFPGGHAAPMEIPADFAARLRPLLAGP
jgi:PPM family protein phosphatase